MGAKPAFKRNKHPFYLTLCMIICLFLSSCQSFSILRTISTSVDTNEKKYLTDTREMVLNKDYKSAAKENQRRLKYYSNIPYADDIILSNYVQNAQIISDLLDRIIEDEETRIALYGKILHHEEQIKSLKKKTSAQKEKQEDMAVLNEKMENLENEKKLLQEQIDRLKEIDLNQDKIIRNPDTERPKQPGDKVTPVIINPL